MIQLLHGSDVSDEPTGCTGRPDFDAGPRGDDVGMPYREPPSLPLSGEPREIGWGPEYEIEDGAKAIFPWLIGK